MIRRFRLFLALLLCLPGSAQEPVALEDNSLYQAALQAMQIELHDIAAQRLNELLATLQEDDPARTEVLTRMSEALVRSGEPAKALEILANPLIAGRDETVFWTAAAQVATGRLKDAADSLATLADSEDKDLRLRALGARARLLASLGNLGEAAKLLAIVEKEAEGPLAADASLLQASLLLESGKPEEAAAYLDKITDQSPHLQKCATYLRGSIAMATGKHEEARSHFEALVTDPSHMGPALHRAATLGHADALHALGNDATALNQLLTYAESRPDSGFLEPIFNRLSTWSGGNPELRAQLLTRLAPLAEAGGTPENSLLRSAGVPTAAEQVIDPAADRSRLGAFARFHHALLLAGENDPESVAKARALLNRLRLDYPTHPLAERSLLETGRLFLADKKPAQALHALQSLSLITDSPALSASASELAGRVEFAQGDFAEAAGAFARARQNLQIDDNYFTAINHGLSLLEAGDDESFSALLGNIDDQEATRTLALEQALVLAAGKDPRAAPLLDLYLRQYPGSPRLVEARLALAEVSLLPETRDLSMSAAQLDSIETSQLSQSFALRHLLARLRLAELSDDWQTAITETTNYIRTHEAPSDAAVLLKLGEAYYQNGDFNDARIQFLQAARKEGSPELQEIALFYAAKAALRVGTDEARKDAIKLFAEVVAADSLLSTDARIQLARAHLDAAKHEEALEVLSVLLEAKEPGTANVDALILSAEAYRLRGQTDDLARCLEVYERILAREDLDYALNNRIHFLKGLTHEQLREPARALDAYYRVINRENLPEGGEITEWKWYYDCGFSALRILEEAKRWPTAHGLARTLANSKGPRAEEARKRAKKLQLDHMIWDTGQAVPEPR